jgi:hypothetical protein
VWSEAVFSCDYNGWTDVPEVEREALEAFESTLQPPVTPPLPLSREAVLHLPKYPERKAA